MENTNFKLLREAYYSTYKSYMDFLRLTNNGSKMFYILILRKPINKDLINVDIIINGINANIEDKNYQFKNTAVLSSTEAKQLIEDIREDFKMYHYVSYCTINTSDHIQRIQNTNYSLNIKLLNNQEVEEAMNFNEKINKNGHRHKALTNK